jgi:hypothetical protein
MSSDAAIRALMKRYLRAPPVKSIHFLFVVLIALAGLSACSAARGAVTPTGVPPLTASLPPLATPPEPAPSLTPSPTSADTATPGPLSTLVLPVMTSDNNLESTITPIATPGAGSESYRLKSWREADALEMIHALETSAHDNDVIMPADSRWLFQTAYRPVELAVQEMLYRFPSTPYREALEWRLAMARVIQGKSTSDAWILAAIERDLNGKRLTLAGLDAGLRQFGFQVAQQVPAPNLFGDGQEATVYRVEALDSYGEQGLFFALRGSDPGRYALVPIYSDWPIPAADDRIVEVKDHNQNGIPEVILETSVASGSMCLSQVLSFEWQGQSFVDLTRGQVHSGDCLDWSFGAPDHAGRDTVTMPTSMEYQDRYAWNGTYYELSERQIDPHWGCSAYNNLLHAWGDYQRGIGALQAVLQNWPADNAELGLSCPDYLRFQIGWAYAQHGEQTRAQTVLQSLVLSPTNPVTPTIPLAAKAFLQAFTAGKDIYRSCSFAQASIAKTLAPYQNNESQGMQAMGLSYAGAPIDVLCDSQVPFPSLVNDLGRSAATNPIPALQQADSDVQASARLNLNGNGVPDWLVVVNDPVQGPTLWALLNTKQGFQAVLLDGYFGADLAGQTTFPVTTYTLPATGNTLLILQIGSSLNLYQFQSTQTGGAVQGVLSVGDVQHYAFRQTGSALELEVAHKADSKYFNMMSIYSWDEKSQSFQLLPLYDNDIFTGNGPAGALPELEQIVANVEETPGVRAVDQPGLFYLLGLAYELTGDDTRAASTYWSLWHDFPDSAYALMAQRKLESSSPRVVVARGGQFPSSLVSVKAPR